MAEEGLDQRGADRRREHERPGGGVRVPALVDEERQQGGDGRLAEVDAEVGAAEEAEASAVEVGAHLATTPWRAMSMTARRVRLERPAVLRAQVAVGVADEVEQHGRGLLRVLDGERSLGHAVGEQALHRLGEDLLGERGAALLVEDDVALGVAEGIEQLEVAVDDAAE